MSQIHQNDSNPTKLSGLQISLLRLFEQNLDPQQTLELRQLVMDYFDQKLQHELETVTSQKGYTEDDYRNMLQDDPSVKSK